MVIAAFFWLSCSVRPFRMARTLSTMTASMPSFTWRYMARIN